MEPMNIDETIDRAEEAQARLTAARQAAAEREAADTARRYAQMASASVSELLELEIPQDAWGPLRDTAGVSAFTVVTPIDTDRPGTADVELALAFRHRGITAGGNVLTVIARDPVEEVWVAALETIESIVDLPGAIDSAVAQAEAWAEAAAEDDRPLEPSTPPPAVVISGDTLADVLARAVVELTRQATA